MCENCGKHGEGGKWFLRASNYSEDMLSDLRRRRYIEGFFRGSAGAVGRPEPMEKLSLVPRVLRPVIYSAILRHMAANHYGQVVTLDEIKQIFGLMGSIVRLPCVCRRITLKEEHRHCFGFALRPDSLGAVGLIDRSYWDGPDGNGLEKLTPDQALQLVEVMDREGLVHSIWTLGTPFIASLCNCSPGECRALKANLDYGLEVMHKGEMISSIDGSRCVGCGKCVSRCCFGALYVASGGSGRRIHLDRSRCHGCGLCVRECRTGAIVMVSLKNDHS